MTRPSKIVAARDATTARAFIRPSRAVLNWSLFPISLIFSRIGENTDKALFCISVQICAHVFGIFSKAAFVSSAAANIAFFTTWAVTLPSWA